MLALRHSFRPEPALKPLVLGVAPGSRKIEVIHAPTAAGLGRRLVDEGLLAPHVLFRALAHRRRHGGRLQDALLSLGLVCEARLSEVTARHWAVRRVDPLKRPPDPRLIDRLGAARALREGLLPWRRIGPATVILTAEPEDFGRHHAALAAIFGPVVMAIAPARALSDALLAARAPRLARAAEERVPEAMSCRRWARRTLPGAMAAAGAILALLAVIAPTALSLLLVGWAVVTLALTAGLKAAATVAALRKPGAAPVPPSLAPDDLPTISIIVALYREAGIAARLVRRLERLAYPRERLDVLLVVEADDAVTRRALVHAGLPPWMRVVVVPPGRVRTKPRALNYALDLCRGSIVGVYDAEDAPDPGQLLAVARRFAAAPPETVCLQGVLDFYNPTQNWLARCFTLEYACWFRLVLPGLARLGLPVPLGGTTLFFRRVALEAVGGWDAHNVTEDADLGIRLCRHGMRTELLDSVTYEEANCRAYPWVRQRSRWIKGYMMTWAVHMRDPMRLWRELGAWRFAGFQVLFLGTLSQSLLAPLLWSFLLVPFGLPHPVADALPPAAFAAMIGAFLFCEAVNLVAGWIGLRRAGAQMSPLWLLTLHGYFPLATLAAYKGLWEMTARPFFWDKTLHGIAPGTAGGEVALPPPPAPALPLPAAHAAILDRWQTGPTATEAKSVVVSDAFRVVQRVRNSPASTRRRVS